MKKGIRKTISVIAILTMTFQMGMPMIPGLTSKVFAMNTSISVAAEKLQATAGEEVVTELSENTDTEKIEEISRNYEIKDEETWDVSANGDGSVIAKWTLNDRTLSISGTGEMKDWNYYNSKEAWHNTIYAELIKKVIIEDGITQIGDDAFHNCSNLQDIEIPEGITSIGSGAFEGCSSLESIEIPESVTSIGSSAFYRCSSLKSIEIPESVTSIRGGAFYRCSSLESIVIPEGVTYIENYAFSGCSSLEGINVDENNTDYISENGILFNKEKTKIICYPAGKKDIKEYVIPSSVTSVESYAFSGCSSLESIDIPSSVTSIGYRAFYECSSLENITIPERITSIGEEAIPESTIIYTKLNSKGHRYAEERGQGYILEREEIENTEEISRNYEIKEETWDVSANGDGSVIAKWTLSDRTLTISGTGKMKDWEYYLYSPNIDWHNTQYTNLIKNVMIENGVTSIGWHAFRECSSLKSITIPSSVSSIENCAFEGCSSLTSIKIPESVTNIENYAFFNCSSLKSIEIPEGVTIIQGYTFSGCSSLESINIPESVTSIGMDAFEGCSSFESINVDVNNKNYMSEDGILFDKEKMKLIKYPVGKKDIKEYTIPSTVTSIGDGAFEGCNSLESIKIQENVTSIGDGAFEGCNSLESIKIQENVTSIGDGAFEGCNSLESIKIQENVTSIASNAIPGSTIIYTKSNSEGHRYAEENEQGYILIYEPGDINGNGFIDITDFLMLKRHLVAGNKTDWILTGNSLEAADMNENGTVDITDMLMLKKVVVENM